MTLQRKYSKIRTLKYWAASLAGLCIINSGIIYVVHLILATYVEPVHTLLTSHPLVGFPSSVYDSLPETYEAYHQLIDISQDVALLLLGTAVILFTATRIYTESRSSKIFITSLYCLLAGILCGFVCNTVRLILFDPITLSEQDLIVTDILIQLVLLTAMLVVVSRYLAPLLKKLDRELHGNFSVFLKVPLIAYITYIINFGIWNSLSSEMTLYKITTSVLVLILYALLYWMILHGVISFSRQVRTERDLDAAHKLQASVLPSQASLREIPDLEVAATITPAREIGGDFYDVIRLDATRTAFVVADVSGKGVSAALFMMQAKLILSDYIRMTSSPGDALTGASVRFLENNDACMFVTVFLGIFDEATGTFTFSSAGHNPPVLKTSGETSYLTVQKEPFLGIKKHIYHTTTLTVHPGDIILLYTDGVTEAENVSGEFYGTARLAAALRTAPDAAGAVSAVLGDLQQFAAGAEQSDDITLLALRYRDRAVPLHVPAVPSQLPDVLAYISGILASGGYDEHAISRALLLSEEVFTNISLYAYPEKEGTVDITAYPDGRIIFSDTGIPFNPLSVPDPDTTMPLEDRPIGGYGIYLVRKLSKSVSYRQRDGKNILNIEVHK